MKLSVIHKHVQRNILWIVLLGIILVLVFWAGAAWADEPKEVKFLNQKPEQYIKTRPATTTTTVAPVVRSRQTQPVVVTTTVPQVVAPIGDWVTQCHAWASEAGVILNDSAIKLLERESHCNPSAQNPSSSACGIAQNIRGCGSDGYGYDPISQLQWFSSYCVGRYGSFDEALAHSLKYSWY